MNRKKVEKLFLGTHTNLTVPKHISMWYEDSRILFEAGLRQRCTEMSSMLQNCVKNVDFMVYLGETNPVILASLLKKN